MNKYLDFNNRMNVDWRIKYNFNCTHAYQKLWDKCLLKDNRRCWFRKSHFVRSIDNACWDARYDMR
jgi:hypothetical protein